MKLNFTWQQREFDVFLWLIVIKPQIITSYDFVALDDEYYVMISVVLYVTKNLKVIHSYTFSYSLLNTKNGTKGEIKALKHFPSHKDSSICSCIV